jgi:hypothetical protein
MSQQTAIAIENSGPFEHLYKAFEKAKDRIKKITYDIYGPDNTEQTLAAPALNELRYVGFHIIRAISKFDRKEQEEELRRAIRHCERASYDIIEIGIAYQLGLFEGFREEFRQTPITATIKDWGHICESINRINAELCEINRFDEAGEEYLIVAEEKLQQLFSITANLPQYRTELDKVQNRRQIRKFFTFSGWAIAVVAVIWLAFTL